MTDARLIFVPAPLTVWAVMQHVDYVGKFVESLWMTEELAETERERIARQYPQRASDYEVEEYFVHESPRED